MNRPTLGVYVIGVVIALVLVNGLTWLIRGGLHARTVGIFSLGFVAGMLPMFIAVHVYRS